MRVRISDYAFGPAAAAPLVRLDHPAREHRTIGVEPLADGFDTQLVEPAEAAAWLTAAERQRQTSTAEEKLFDPVSAAGHAFGRDQ